jgi:predicted NAD/FAD-binding protein
LYFIPPLSAKITSASQLDALQLVATKLARVVQFNGTAEAPLRHVHLANVTIAHSAYTYMEQYEIPSGGE